MADKDIASAKDGLPARVSGHWAAQKLHIVGHYQAIFAKSMARKWPALGYVDLMAGPGLCIDKGTRDEYLGSPLRSLACPFTHRVFVELQPDLATALATRTGQPADVITGNCNADTTISEIRKRLPPNALTLVFVDNLGLNCTFATLRALAAGRKMDLLITVMTNDLQRNARSPHPEDDARFTAFFGSSGWRDVAEAAAAANKSGGEIADDLLDYYGEQLKTLGYPYFTPARRVMKNSKQSALYRLVLASAHQRGEDFFRKIEKISFEGQREMFE